MIDLGLIATISVYCRGRGVCLRPLLLLNPDIADAVIAVVAVRVLVLWHL